MIYEKTPPLSYTEKKLPRMNFGEHISKIKIPSFINIQKKSYEKLVKSNKENRTTSRLNKLLKKPFPIYSRNKKIKLEYISYSLNECSYTPSECKLRGLSYAAPLKIKVRLLLAKAQSTLVDIKKSITQNVYILSLPLMTETGTFIVNGIEKVIVSQLHKSPGLFFEINKSKSSANKTSYLAKIIPYRGSWLDIEFDSKNCLFAKIDKKKKFPVTLILKALGMSTREILDQFVTVTKVILDFNEKKIKIKSKDIDKKAFGEQSYSESNDTMIASTTFLIDKILASNIKSKSRNIIIPFGVKINIGLIDLLIKEKITNIDIIQTKFYNYKQYIPNTLNIDTSKTQISAIREICKIIKPGEPQTKETAKQFFEDLFFSRKKYDLSPVGRMKINAKLNNYENKKTTLSKQDILSTIKKLINIKDKMDFIDDIDHLGNRRIRNVGEILENQIKIGISKLERSAKEKLSISEKEGLKPQDIINAKGLATTVRDFFYISQLSQFMDQTNPLAELTHKRRLSALGPGGLTRERAGFEVRDVHNTHYGKICPIETPEGPNIGLINSLAIYAKINSYGFLETPYIEIKKGKITDKLKYLSAVEESDVIIAQANTKFNKYNNELVNEKILCRYKHNFLLTNNQRIEYVDVSPDQTISAATAAIPFLEHDDANRALMGSNMQRQAVPIIRATKPLVGTGIEKKIAMHSGATILAKRSGVVIKVDAFRIIIKVEKLEIDNTNSSIDTYELLKYQKSNQNTCINQKPLVQLGDKIKKNEIIADGAATHLGELALGQNLFIAFMPWNGLNFEDSIILSEKLVKENKLTSIHIEEFICAEKEFKKEPEEITLDIPIIHEKHLKNLDEFGIIHIGAEVKPGDILVGKVTRNIEIKLSPEEKLLQAIFCEKPIDVKDSSLRTPLGINGTVVDVKIFTRSDTKKDARTIEIETEKFKYIRERIKDQLRSKKRIIFDRIHELVLKYKKINKTTNINLYTVIKTKIKNFDHLEIKNKVIKKEILKKKRQIKEINKKYLIKFREQKARILKKDDLPTGVTKMVKVLIAMKRQIQIGDKLSGRHGNKGVVSAIVPVEDMPYLEDGSSLEVVLNPLSVPSRMNLGQILETNLGWAVKKFGEKIKLLSENPKNLNKIKNFIHHVYNIKNKNLDLNTFSKKELEILIKNLKDGFPIATPVFNGIKESEIKLLLKIAGVPKLGKTTLYDGKTGLPFDCKTTIGYQYIMKLNHLIDNKIHARSTGSYSIISQQPLGGKAQFGGQRFGEMEVWALEAYGAAYTLQEMLTIKSDDIIGRTQIYKNIIDNKHKVKISTPESFNVLTKELLALGLNFELDYK